MRNVKRTWLGSGAYYFVNDVVTVVSITWIIGVLATTACMIFAGVVFSSTVPAFIGTTGFAILTFNLVKLYWQTSYIKLQRRVSRRA